MGHLNTPNDRVEAGLADLGSAPGPRCRRPGGSACNTGRRTDQKPLRADLSETSHKRACRREIKTKVISSRFLQHAFPPAHRRAQPEWIATSLLGVQGPSDSNSLTRICPLSSLPQLQPANQRPWRCCQILRRVWEGCTRTGGGGRLAPVVAAACRPAPAALHRAHLWRPHVHVAAAACHEPAAIDTVETLRRRSHRLPQTSSRR